ncbi:DUF3168 domain-containing protein [Sedimentimonas flavescens]|uniref:DUF3168 domain-containing protein n=1 Tax=Sedimentimonas flavescens TaxID=2851012 RepID=UPI001C4A70FE|nr:DUF3168 domain-containing protein [Sedimentimonas flavescens]MBW0157274.1 DUF3168 domain-containing protein [Sedimentimonas flavescens]
MSYAISAALQAAIYQRLLADPGVSALVGGAVYDAVPPGEAPMTYVTLGPEDVQDASDMTGAGATHDFVVSVVTGEAGFHGAKEIAAAISDALSDAALVLERGALVALWFVRAKARRVEKGNTRRIDLTFRARVEG